MAPLQAINSWTSIWTTERLAHVARLATTLPRSLFRKGREDHVDATECRPDERGRREIARLTGVYHEPRTSRPEIDGHIIRAARHYF